MRYADRSAVTIPANMMNPTERIETVPKDRRSCIRSEYWGRRQQRISRKALVRLDDGVWNEREVFECGRDNAGVLPLWFLLPSLFRENCCSASIVAVLLATGIVMANGCSFVVTGNMCFVIVVHARTAIACGCLFVCLFTAEERPCLVLSRFLRMLCFVGLCFGRSTTAQTGRIVLFLEE